MFNKEKKGFTLVELLVTIFVIMIGLIAAYKVASYPLSQISISMNRLTAAYLAQEGIEIVRNIRDTNWVDDSASLWKEGLESGSWEADYDDENLSVFSNRYLNFEGSSSFYGYEGGVASKYKRKIEIEDLDDGDGNDILKITVTVSWSEKGKDYSFDLQENLYNYWDRED